LCPEMRRIEQGAVSHFLSPPREPTPVPFQARAEPDAGRVRLLLGPGPARSDPATQVPVGDSSEPTRPGSARSNPARPMTAWLGTEPTAGWRGDPARLRSGPVALSPGRRRRCGGRGGREGRAPVRALHGPRWIVPAHAHRGPVGLGGPWGGRRADPSPGRVPAGPEAGEGDLTRPGPDSVGPTGGPGQAGPGRVGSRSGRGRRRRGRRSPPLQGRPQIGDRQHWRLPCAADGETERVEGRRRGGRRGGWTEGDRFRQSRSDRQTDTDRQTQTVAHRQGGLGDRRPHFHFLKSCHQIM
jgi:hypothetical protein